MPKETVNWNDVDTWKRIIASIYATGVKIDLTEAAKYYGTTYWTLENKMRVIRKDALALKEELKDGGGEGIPSRAKSAATTPKSKTPKKDALHTVASGRVAKTPSKKGGIKQEPMEDDEDVEATDSFMGDDDGSD